jgi:hypothetical protein
VPVLLVGHPFGRRGPFGHSALGGPFS